MYTANVKQTGKKAIIPRLPLLHRVVPILLSVHVLVMRKLLESFYWSPVRGQPEVTRLLRKPLDWPTEPVSSYQLNVAQHRNIRNLISD